MISLVYYYICFYKFKAISDLQIRKLSVLSNLFGRGGGRVEEREVSERSMLFLTQVGNILSQNG